MAGAITKVEGELERVMAAIKAWEDDPEAAFKGLKKGQQRFYKDTDNYRTQLQAEKTALQAEKTLLVRKDADLVRKDADVQAEKTAIAQGKFKGSAWESLRTTLPKREFSPKSAPSGTGLRPVNFPAAPTTVRSFPHEAFLAMCAELGLVQSLKDLPVDQSLQTRFQVLTEQKISARLEQQVQGCVESTLGSLLWMCTKTNILANASVSGRTKTLGDCDFEVGEDWDGVREFGNVVLVGEVKTPRSVPDSMAEVFCDFGCGGCKTSERHKDVSVVRQLYNYMVINNRFFGLFSSHDHWAGFFRDCEGNLLITPSLAWDQTDPYTVPQFLVLFYKVALTGALPSCIGKFSSGVLVSCTDKECEHNRLPTECSVAHRQSGCKPRGTDVGTKVRFVDSSSPSESLSVHDLEMGEFIGRFRSGSARRASLPRGGAEGVLKLADIFKSPELEDELLHEAVVYGRLKDLQGKSVPRLLASGRFTEDFLFGVMTSDEGIDATNFEADDAFVSKAMEALGQIHALGVLHKDIRKENILRNAAGDPVFIDFSLSEVAPTITPEWRQHAEAEMVELSSLFPTTEK